MYLVLSFIILITSVMYVKFCIKQEIHKFKCNWCMEFGHTISECKHFCQAYKNTTPYSYVGVLNEYDNKNFYAAGFLIYRYHKERLYILAVPNGDQYFLPGGSREHQYETPFMVAHRKLLHHTEINLKGSNFIPSDTKIAAWYTNSKYVLIPIKLYPDTKFKASDHAVWITDISKFQNVTHLLLKECLAELIY